MTEAGRRFNLSPQIVLFFDFLGFSELVSEVDAASLARTTELLDLLAKRSNFAIEGTADGDDRFNIRTTAALTAFSDNVVMSYELEPEGFKDGSAATPEMALLLAIHRALNHMATVLGAIAFKALDLNLLLRGGIAIGPLYHRDGVVIGPAMIEAYRTEATTSVYPRAVVARSLFLECDERIRRQHLIQDHDGLWHLNYFSKITEVAVEELDIGLRHDWRRSQLERIDQQIEKLESKGAIGPASKWTYFKRHFLESVLPQYSGLD